jgi:hypothetical protein
MICLLTPLACSIFCILHFSSFPDDSESHTHDSGDGSINNALACPLLVCYDIYLLFYLYGPLLVIDI